MLPKTSQTHTMLKMNYGGGMTTNLQFGSHIHLSVFTCHLLSASLFQQP